MNLITERFPIKLSLANVLFASLLAACGGDKVSDGQAQQNSNNGVAQNDATLTEQEKIRRGFITLNRSSSSSSSSGKPVAALSSSSSTSSSGKLL
ncbi:MAG TPA: hypothetical protein PKZ52_09140, partial [Cellvibrionaceae bacterium]|nr:hypothetical protein [Cellvibrionaceae bacterium]